MERNGAQRYLLQYEFVSQWMRARKVRIIGHDTYSNKTDPKLGVEAVLPGLYRHGKVRLPGHPVSEREMKSLVTELCTYPNGATSDEVMSEWMGEFNLPLLRKRPQAKTIRRKRPSWARRQEVA